LVPTASSASQWKQHRPPGQGRDNISWGGWIVAIGLSQVQPIANDIMEFFYIDGYALSSPIFNALLRLHHRLGNMVKAFPEKEIVREAEELMQRCTEKNFI